MWESTKIWSLVRSSLNFISNIENEENQKIPLYGQWQPDTDGDFVLFFPSFKVITTTLDLIGLSSGINIPLARDGTVHLTFCSPQYLPAGEGHNPSSLSHLATEHFFSTFQLFSPFYLLMRVLTLFLFAACLFCKDFLYSFHSSCPVPSSCFSCRFFVKLFANWWYFWTFRFYVRRVWHLLAADGSIKSTVSRTAITCIHEE